MDFDYANPDGGTPLNINRRRANLAALHNLVDTPKVPKAEFEAAIRALLKAPPTPLAEIPKKQVPKAKAKRPAKKHGQ
jgi:hypothetical protein